MHHGQQLEISALKVTMSYRVEQADSCWAYGTAVLCQLAEEHVFAKLQGSLTQSLCKSAWQVALILPTACMEFDSDQQVTAFAWLNRGQKYMFGFKYVSGVCFGVCFVVLGS